MEFQTLHEFFNLRQKKIKNPYKLIQKLDQETLNLIWNWGAHNNTYR